MISFTFRKTFQCNNDTGIYIANDTHQIPHINPISTPYHQQYLKVSDIHTIYYEQYGNPEGKPIVVIHGGPGSGGINTSHTLFDLSFYRLIYIDQRGCGKSLPFGEIRENRTDLLIEDMEKVRYRLNIEKWTLFGGSWGGALAILYAEKHPERCHAIITRGTSRANKCNLNYKLHENLGFRYPEYYVPLLSYFNSGDNLLDECYNYLNNESISHDDKVLFAKTFLKYNDAISFLNPSNIKSKESDEYILCLVKIYFYYNKNDFFIHPKSIIENIKFISHIPICLIHGRMDMNCPPNNSFTFHQRLGNNSTLVLVECAGHSQSEPGIQNAIIMAQEGLKNSF